MRPSAFTDGNSVRRVPKAWTMTGCFNEAVGFHRRKRSAHARTQTQRAGRFNEAVGFHRRKRVAASVAVTAEAGGAAGLQ